MLVVMNWFYEKTSFKEYAYDNADQYFQINKVKNCELVYTSASSNFSQKTTEDKGKLSQYIGQFYPSLAMEAFNIPATHVGTHYKLLQSIPKENHVQTMICAVNLRSFGADWRHSELETALNKSLVMSPNRPVLLNRLLVSLNAYDNKSQEERAEQRMAEWSELTLPYEAPMNSVSNWCAVEKWGDWSNPKRQLADQFIKQYAFVVDDNNQRIKDLDKIVELAAERNWNLVLSILPENIDKADSLVGPKLINLMYSNSEWIKHRYEHLDHVKVLNNIAILSSQHFTDKDFPTEHYDEQGRKLIASYVAFALRKHHSKAFASPAWSTNLNFK